MDAENVALVLWRFQLLHLFPQETRIEIQTGGECYVHTQHEAQAARFFERFDLSELENIDCLWEYVFTKLSKNQEKWISPKERASTLLSLELQTWHGLCSLLSDLIHNKVDEL